jgi:acetyltransferase-like isoleucine patch superfamily enzyme
LTNNDPYVEEFERLGLGIEATVKDGVRIGPGSLIGAGAVVLSDIPGGVVAHGMPARIKRELSRK